MPARTCKARQGRTSRAGTAQRHGNAFRAAGGGQKSDTRVGPHGHLHSSGRGGSCFVPPASVRCQQAHHRRPVCRACGCVGRMAFRGKRLCLARIWTRRRSGGGAVAAWGGGFIQKLFGAAASGGGVGPNHSGPKSRRDRRSDPCPPTPGIRCPLAGSVARPADGVRARTLAMVCDIAGDTSWASADAVVYLWRGDIRGDRASTGPVRTAIVVGAVGGDIAAAGYLAGRRLTGGRLPVRPATYARSTTPGWSW